MNNRDAYIDFIIDNLKTGNVSRQQVLSIFGKKWQTSERTFDRAWKVANEQYSEYLDVLKKAKDSEHTEEQLTIIKAKIGSKTERLLNYKIEVDNCIQELSTNRTFDTVVVNGRVQKVSRELSVSERSRLRTVIIGLQTEISKIEGDYAPAKGEMKVTNEQPLFKLD